MFSSSIIHHVSVINRNIDKTFQFYHDLLGLDLVLKTVNQDDVEMYHLFFGDTKGRPGTEFTIFQIKDGVDRTFGTNAIERTVFAVPNEAALYFWERRLNEFGIFNCEIEEYNDSKILRFEDFDGVQLGIVAVRDVNNDFFPRKTREIDLQHAILGIDSVHLRVRYPLATAKNMQHMFHLEHTKTISQGDLPTLVLTKNNTLFNQEIHIIEDKRSALEVQGIGSAHHIALSVKNTKELSTVEQKVVERNFKNSGVKFREFFTSIYFREPNQLLFEVATEESSLVKENYGTTNFDDIPLALPSFLEPQRESIERHLHK